MALQYWFWFLVAIIVLFRLFGHRFFTAEVTGGRSYVLLGGDLATLLLIVMLGWQVFGSPVK